MMTATCDRCGDEMVAAGWTEEDTGPPPAGSVVVCMVCGTLYTVAALGEDSSVIRLTTPEEAIALRDALVAAGRGADLDEIAAIYDAYERRRLS